MNIKVYEEQNYDQRVDDLTKWSEQDRLYLKCLNNVIEGILCCRKDELYEVTDVIDEHGLIYFYISVDSINIDLKGCGNDLVISELSDDFEIVVKNTEE